MANALAQALKSSDAKEKINASQKLVEQYCKQALQTLNENRQGSSAYQSVLALSENALGITAYYANQIEAARKHLRKSIGIYPDNALGYGYLALLCLKTDDELQALRWLEESLAWGIRQPHIDYLYYQFGQYHHKNGNLAKAQEYYRKATESAVSWNALGELFAEQESKREAIECFQKAVKLNSRTMRFWANLADQIALTFNDEASLQEAYTAADRALNLENNWYTRNIRGVVLFKQGKFEKAEKDILESIKKSPRLLNHYHLALLNEKRGNTKRALELLEIALSLKNNRDEVSWVQQAAKLRTELQQRSAAARI
jgi:tetratricopeptide (TPR) repeat protein